jgi:hypothetical protein
MRAVKIAFPSLPRLGFLVWLWLLACLVLPFSARALSPLIITNVSVVNVSPSSFSLVWANSSVVAPSVSVYADAGGLTNLAGQVGLELYPLHTGDPSLTNAYARRLNEASLRQKTASQDLAMVRISDCLPGVTYYYRLQTTNSFGQQAVWPASGPLPGVTTAQSTAFVLDSQQLLLNLPGFDPSGSVVILSNSNTPSLLAAVAGDGAPSNEVFFSVSDMLAAAGNTNFTPLGVQEFTATVMGLSSNAVAQTYSVDFTAQFAVGGASQFSLGNYAVLSLGSSVMQAGTTAVIPINLYASGITNLSYVLNLPTNRFSAISLQALSSQLGVVSLQTAASNRLQLTFGSAPGQTLLGNQELAQLNLTAISNQTSAFIPLAPQSLQGLNADGSIVNNFAVESGRLVVVGNDPLLEALRAANGSRSLALYGLPGDAYEIQSATNLAQPVAWQNVLSVPMTNLQAVLALNSSPPNIFYRAYSMQPDPPIVQALLSGASRTLLVYGRPGTNYVVQYTTNLSGVVTWRPALSYTLTNAFQYLNGLANTNALIFYRLQRP